MKLRALVIVSIVTNVALAAWILLRPASASPAHGAVGGTPTLETPSVPLAGVLSTSNPASTNQSRPGEKSGFDWSQIESSDYRQYIANLRAAGGPEPVIRDLIVTDVRKLFVPRMKEILGQRPSQEYWQKPTNQQPSREVMERLSALAKEEGAIVKSLLGFQPSSQALVDQLALQTDSRRAELAWLPPEQRDAARRAFQEAGLRDEEIGFANTNNSGEDHFTTERKRLERRLALLQDILTPEQLEEYRIRSSIVAAQVRQDAIYFEATPEEFKALLKIRENFSEKGGDYFVKQRQQEEAVRTALGEDRFQEFRRSTDLTYRAAMEATERYGMPSEIADRIWQLKQDTEAAAQTLHADKSLTEEERQRRLTVLQEEAKETILQSLGPNGGKMAMNGAGAWVHNLTSPRR